MAFFTKLFSDPKVEDRRCLIITVILPLVTVFI